MGALSAVILVTTGFIGGIILVTSFLGVLLYALAGGALWVGLLICLAFMTGGMQSIVRMIDPEYNHSKQDLTNNIADQLREKGGDLRAMAKETLK